MRVGKIIKQIGASPQKHELLTADTLALAGFDIEFIAPLKGKKTPDIKMDGLEWEIKSPVNAGKYTIEHAIESAAKQANYIIIDLRRSKMPEQKCLAKVRREAEYRSSLKKVLVINKNGGIVDVK